MEGLVEGRIVHFVLAKNYNIENSMEGIRSREEKTICRPAMIVNAWDGKLNDGMVNLQIFLDGSNDDKYLQEAELQNLLVNQNSDMTFLAWATSVKYSETKEINTWHWPERS